MISVLSFTFNPWSENTYVLFDESKEAVIIDPGCYEQAEKELLEDELARRELKPVRLLNTHCHIDHVLGNRFVAEKYGLVLEMHEGEIPVLEAVMVYGSSMGVTVEESPKPGKFLKEGDVVTFGQSKLEVLYTPGHSPASICFLSKEDEFVIAGDTVFDGSIGRTDLPGGDLNTLLNSISTRLLVLDDATRIYSGHGPATTVGKERKSNPFLLHYLS